MPICPYFVSGKCSYGSKCYNDHINVSQVIQAEMKAAVCGNQWPLSCFGPLKDEPCLPNFNKDLSFEEVRFNYYTAKMANTLPQFEEQFKRTTIQAIENMRKFVIMDATVQNYLIEVFGVNGKKNLGNVFNSGGLNEGTFINNPFSTTAIGTGTDQSIGGSGSIFDRISSNNSFGNSGRSFFTSPGTTATPAANSIFGGSSGGGIFGGNIQAQQQQQSGGTSVFGQSIFNQSPQQQTQFGQQTTTQNSFFKLPQLGQPQQQQPVSTGNIFGNTGQQQQPQSAFGHPPAFNRSPGGIFATSPTQQTQPSPMLFQSAQNMPPFGATTQQPNQQNIFGSKQGFGFPATGQQNQNIFSNPVLQQAQSQPPQNIFATQPPQQQEQQPLPPNPFIQQQQQQQQQTGNIFGNVIQNSSQSQQVPVPAQSSVSIFNTQTQIPQPIFGSQPENKNIFGSNQQEQQQQYQRSERFYSKLEELSQEDLQAFQADDFQLGSIPIIPPPRELC